MSGKPEVDKNFELTLLQYLKNLFTFEKLTQTDFLIKKFDPQTKYLKVQVLARENGFKELFGQNTDLNIEIILKKLLLDNNNKYWSFDSDYDLVKPIFAKQRRLLCVRLPTSQLEIFESKCDQLTQIDHNLIKEKSENLANKAETKLYLTFSTEEIALSAFRLIQQKKNEVDQVKLEDIDLDEKFVQEINKRKNWYDPSQYMSYGDQYKKGPYRGPKQPWNRQLGPPQQWQQPPPPPGYYQPVIQVPGQYPPPPQMEMIDPQQIVQQPPLIFQQSPVDYQQLLQYQQQYGQNQIFSVYPPPQGFPPMIANSQIPPPLPIEKQQEQQIQTQQQQQPLEQQLQEQNVNADIAQKLQQLSIKNEHPEQVQESPPQEQQQQQPQQQYQEYQEHREKNYHNKQFQNQRGGGGYRRPYQQNWNFRRDRDQHEYKGQNHHEDQNEQFQKDQQKNSDEKPQRTYEDKQPQDDQKYEYHEKRNNYDYYNKKRGGGYKGTYGGQQKYYDDNQRSNYYQKQRQEDDIREFTNPGYQKGRKPQRTQYVEVKQTKNQEG